MARWLVKTEPEEYSFDDLRRKGRDAWDGVRSNVALKHLREMRPGDEVFVYHTGSVRSVVGIARVVSEPYPDPKTGNPKETVVDLEAVRPLERPVSLASIKADPAFAGWILVRNSRLSVGPVPDELWARILAMSAGSTSG